MDCIDIVRTQVKDATPEELNEILGTINNRFARIMADGTMTAEQAVKQAAKETGEAMKLSALIEKRNAVINRAARASAMDFINTSFADMPLEGVEALLGSVSYSRKGARDSVISAQRALEKRYISQLEKELSKAGVFEIFASNSMSIDIARALWSIDDPAVFGKLPKEAQTTAKIISKLQEQARADANSAGAWIGKMNGYIVRQSHDPTLMLRAGKDAWIAGIKDKLDFNKMFPNEAPENIDDWLGQTYENLVTGIHDNVSADASKMAGFIGPGNLAKKASAERVLHFKSADDWHAYNAEFGKGFLSDAVVSGLMRSAESTGLMMKLGTNPEYNLKSILDSVKTKAVKAAKTPKERAAVDAKAYRIQRLYDQVSGKTNSPVNATVARAMANARSWVRLTSLGGAVISSITDIPARATELRYQGKGFFSDLTEGLADLLKGRSNEERQAILWEIEEYAESMIGSIAQRYDPDAKVGTWMAKAEKTFFKLNLQTLWTDRNRSGAAMAISRNAGSHHGKAWAELPEQFRNVVQMYNIDEAEWAKINKSAISEVEGKRYLTPEGIDAVDKGIGMKWRQFMADRVDIAYLNPDSKTRDYMIQGTRPGTGIGEAIRAFMQYKTFPAVMLQKVVARELYGYGKTSIRDIRAREFMGLATLIASTTAAGYLAMTVKDLLKGRSPRPISGEGAEKTYMAAMLQGGALGIYGDFLFGETNRLGGGLWETMAGPLVGKTGETVNLIKETAGKGYEGELKQDNLAKWFRLGVNNTPFNNVFWIRPALDYAILYNIQETLSPGYLRRMERRIQKDQGQTFWLRPTEAAQ